MPTYYVRFKQGDEAPHSTKLVRDFIVHTVMGFAPGTFSGVTISVVGPETIEQYESARIVLREIPGESKLDTLISVTGDQFSKPVEAFFAAIHMLERRGLKLRVNTATQGAT